MMQSLQDMQGGGQDGGHPINFPNQRPISVVSPCSTTPGGLPPPPLTPRRGEQMSQESMAPGGSQQSVRMLRDRTVTDLNKEMTFASSQSTGGGHLRYVRVSSVMRLGLGLVV